MPEPKRTPLGQIRAELSDLWADVRGMFSLRWELARLELDSDLQALKRLAIVLVIVAVAVLAVPPVLVVVAAELLDGTLGIARVGWLGILAGVLFFGAVLVGWLAWLRFRRSLVGLEETLEELQEDALWLHEFSGRQGDDSPTDNSRVS